MSEPGGRRDQQQLRIGAAKKPSALRPAVRVAGGLHFVRFTMPFLALDGQKMAQKV